MIDRRRTRRRLLLSAGWAALLFGCGAVDAWATTRSAPPRSPHPAVRFERIPSWVEALPVEPLEAVDSTSTESQAPPANNKTRPTTYRWVDRQVLLPARGPVEAFSDFQVYLGTQADLETWGIWEIPFQPSYQVFALHRLEVLRDGVWSDRLTASRLSVIQREDDLRRLIYDQNQTLVVLVGDLRVGDTVRIAYTRRGSNPVYGKRYGAEFGLTASIPVARQRLRLRSAPERSLRAQIHRGDEVIGTADAAPSAAPVERSDASPTANGPTKDSLAGLPKVRIVRDEQGWQEIRWSGRNVEPSEYEWNAPESWFSLPTLAVSEFRDWAEVAAWSIPLYRPRAAPPEVVEVARKIARVASDPGARLVAARNWVQKEIRYFALAVDEHTHQPYDLSEVLARRYGDCKDKTTLLLALLRELDIEAWPAFVHTERRAGIARDLPSPRVFDHVIAVARINDQSVWIDPTLSHQGGKGPKDIYVPNYGLALESRPNVTGLTALPVEARGQGKSRHRYVYWVPENGAASAVIESEFTGHLAEQQRRSLDTTSEADLAEQYVDFYTSAEATVEQAEDLEIQDSRSANKVEIRESYKLQREEEDEFSFETLDLLMRSDLPYPDVGERETPYALPFPLHRIEKIELTGEDLGPFETVRESVTNPWFRYSARSTKVPDGIHVTYELETLAPQVPAAEIDRYREDVDRLFESLGYQIARQPEMFSDDLWGASSDRVQVILISGSSILVLTALVLFGTGVWFMFRR